MDHRHDIEGDSRNLLLEYWAQLSALLLPAEFKVLMPSWDRFVSIYGKLLVNCVSLYTGRLDYPSAFGTGLYLSVSALDHSCEPNAKVRFDGGTAVTVVSMKDIDSFDVGSVRISYVDPNASVEWRQRELRAIWYFTCDCGRCKEQQCVSRE